MPGTPEIRSCAPDDRDAVVALWRRCGLLTPWNDPDADIAGFAAHASATLLVGVSNGSIVATAAAAHDGHRGWLYCVAVHPDRRRQGAGAALVAAAESWLADRGVAKVQLMVRPPNLAARRFYAALGYHCAPRTFMQRWLVPPPDQEFDLSDAGRDDGRIEVTVTWLEMTAPPQTAAHPPVGAPLALIRAERPHPSFYRYLYGRVGEPWFWHERQAWDDGTLVRTIHDELVEIYVLYVAGCPAGFAELDLRRLAETRAIELAYLGMMPEHIGRGLGRWLLQSAIGEAWRRQPERLTVNTCTLDHPRAIGAYQRAGFVPVRQRTDLVPDPRRTGIIPPDTPLPRTRNRV